MKKVLLFLLVAACYIGAFTVDQKAVDALSKKFSVGEYLTIPLSFTDYNDVLTCKAPSGQDRFLIEFGWDNGERLNLKINQCTCQSESWTWESQQVPWIEIIADKPFNEAKKYSGWFEIYDSEGNTQSQKVKFSFDVAAAPTDDLGVLFADPTASFSRQIDIETYLSNPTNETKSINTSFLDYYFLEYWCSQRCTDCKNRLQRVRP